jgi:hypothetical protein
MPCGSIHILSIQAAGPYAAKAGRSAILAATTGTEGTVVALRLSGTIELIIFGLDNVRYWPKADMACGTAHASYANMQK